MINGYTKRRPTKLGLFWRSLQRRPLLLWDQKKLMRKREQYIFSVAEKIKIEEKEVAIFLPRHNTGGRHDSTGAFQPETLGFSQKHKLDYRKAIFINNQQGRYATARELLSKMEEKQEENNPIPIWVFFCHGYTHGIQFGIRSPGHRTFTLKDSTHFQKFTSIIAQHPSPVVVLYACSTGNDPDGDPDTAPGSGDDSFADFTRDTLCRKGAKYCRVFSHTNSGHTSLNPNIKIMDGKGRDDGAEGGSFLYDPGTQEFRKLAAELKTDFRFLIPFMTEERIDEELNVTSS